MTTEEIRNARKSFAAQLTSMIRDFERQTGATVQGINVERERFKTWRSDGDGSTVSIFKGVFISLGE